MNNREEIYLNNGFMQGLQREINNFSYYLRNTGYYVHSPSLHTVEKLEKMNFQLTTILFTVIFFLFVIDVILIYSIMLNDVEERTYEFAMLRTLGFKNTSLVVLLIVQALFFSLPATFAGFGLLFIMKNAA